MKLLAYWKAIALALLLAGLAVLFVLIEGLESERREVKEDLVELQGIEYGLFNVDEWQMILSGIMAKKIEELDMSRQDKAAMRKRINNFLTEMINDLDRRTHEKNTGVSGFFKNAVADFTGIFDRMREDVPIFTDQIMSFIDNPQNRTAVKGFLEDKLDEYAKETFSRVDYTLHDSIIAKHGKETRAETMNHLSGRLEALQSASDSWRQVLVGLALAAALFFFLLKGAGKAELLLAIGICLLLLGLGLSLPMIEIDARIAAIKMEMMGEPIVFTDQVLYYKSKSILEVVSLMMSRGAFDMLLVGSLVFVFSVLFPFSKLLASAAVVIAPRLEKNRALDFLIHKTGKWSMADVMVVAIFMAYIGFSGILTEQLGQLEHISTKIDMLTTNRSSLQTGFYAFTAFAVLSLILSGRLKGRG